MEPIFNNNKKWRNNKVYNKRPQERPLQRQIERWQISISNMFMLFTCSADRCVAILLVDFLSCKSFFIVMTCLSDIFYLNIRFIFETS